MLDIPSGSEVLRLIGDQVSTAKPSDTSSIKLLLQEFRKAIPRGRSESIEVVDCGSSGLGFFATADIVIGSCILIDHPIVSVLDCELGEASYSGQDGSDSIALAEKIGMCFNEDIERALEQLHPFRLGSTSPDSSAIIIPESVRSCLNDLIPAAISKDLLLRTVQCNSLGFYTCPELCSYNDHLRFLTGTGLYPVASFFNHSCSPNVSHMSFGDVTIFRVNRNISKGEELFISYIGTDLLCESTSVRHEFIGSRDFVCHCEKCSLPETEDPWVEELTLDVRLSLKLISQPARRSQFMRNLLKTHSFIQRDRLELQFMLSREFNEAGALGWKELIEHAVKYDDLSSIAIIFHYMVRNGFCEDLFNCCFTKGAITLGPELGNPRNLTRLFELTDFNDNSDLYREFRNIVSGRVK
ncbi:hypothetical protein C9890_0036 [Perkinsus sp. BL_2016]|nr:hypothetical protein C9890_0036 [Perkinsus sp. BL_2016]